MPVPIVLAAGASSRMGSPKALLDFDGAVAIELLLDACRGAGCASPIVVLGSDADRIIERLSFRRGDADRGLPAGGVRLVINPRWRSGRTSSLKTGLALLPEGVEAFLICPVDCPLVRHETLERLMEAAREPFGKPDDGRIDAATPPAGIIVPSYGGRRGHPALCSATLRREFLALGDDDPAKQVIRSDPRRVSAIEVDDPAILDNLDTPSDHAHALARWRSRHG